MEIIIEYKKNSSSPTYNPIKKPNYIAIAHDNQEESYYLIYDEKKYLIDKNDINELLDILSSVKINRLPEFAVGVDGETYTIKILQGWNSVEFKWWSDSCGDQWKCLFIFREKILELKEKCLKNVE